MKKIALLLVLTTLVLCACSKPAQPTQPSETVPATTPATAPAATDPVSTDPSQAPVNELFEKAKTCKGKTVAELYALIGEPDSSDYAPSCLGPGEDGNLYYDGFTVYTYREGDKETVEHIIADK